jgi:ribosome assembly protein 4
MPRKTQLTHNDAQIWDLKTYKIHTDLPGHTDEVYCVDFVADKIVSGGKDTTLKMCACSIQRVQFKLTVHDCSWKN